MYHSRLTFNLSYGLPNKHAFEVIVNISSMTSPCSILSKIKLKQSYKLTLKTYSVTYLMFLGTFFLVVNFGHVIPLLSLTRSENYEKQVEREVNRRRHVEDSTPLCRISLKNNNFTMS